MLKKLVPCALAAALAVAFVPAANAAGGPSGPKVAFHVQGHIGEIVVNPYRIAPLTAVIKNGGYALKTPRFASSRRTTAPKSSTT